MQLARMLLGTVVATAFVGSAHADSRFALGSTVFRESGGPLNMLVIAPAAETSLELLDELAVDANWTADIVSGASVAVVDDPGAVDTITSASMTDIRHAFSGGIEFRGESTSLRGGMGYAFENDYRSLSFDLSARTELFDRNTGLQLAYTRGLDDVCDAPNPRGQYQRLDNSVGCFKDRDMRATRDVDLHTFQGAWSQAWTPVLTMQTTVTAQLLNGFQGNPYRAVWNGSASQEHHPDNRARYSAGLELRLWLKPMNGALSAVGRVYRDTWNITSLTTQLAYEQVISGGIRIRGSGRYYNQTAAAFYSDDYVLQPRGQYFTGDRELSAMRSLLLGLKVTWAVPSNDEGYVLGFLNSFELVANFDLLKSWFDDFHYGTQNVPNTLALVGSLGLQAGF